MKVGSRRLACVCLFALLVIGALWVPAAGSAAVAARASTAGAATGAAGSPTAAGAPLAQPMTNFPSANAALVALAPTPPMGWNPWYEFGCKINEHLVEQTARAIVSSGMAADGYKYVNLDDCWMAPQRDANGNLQANPTTFPDGIAALASYIHGLGLKLGIYLDAGQHTCMGFPGSGSHLAQDAATVASWGVDYIKLDYCATGSAPAERVYAAMHQVLLSIARPMVLSVSDDGIDKPWLWGAPIANLWRTTNDYTTFGAQSGHWWSAMLTVVDRNARLFRYAAPGAWNDPDMLLTGTGRLTVPQERSQFSLWSMMAAPLLVDGDLRTMSAATASIVMNREVIAVDQDSAGLQGVRIADSGTQQVWLRTLTGGSHAVLFFNTGQNVATMQMRASLAGLEHRRYAVRDLWRHRSWDSSAAIIRVSVRPDDVVMLRVQPASQS